MIAAVYSPAHWAILGLVIVLIISPSLLRPLARMLGYWLGNEVRRKAGMPTVSARPVAPPQRPRAPIPVEAEIRPIEVADDGSTTTVNASIRPIEPRQKRASEGLVLAVVVSGVAVLLWWVLKSS